MISNQNTILYVEDDFIIRKKTVNDLNKNGYTVIEAKNGKEGFELFNKVRPDLIITDLQMDVMNGGELVDAVRSCGCQIPIMIITAYPEIAQQLEGTDALLVKPVMIDKLLKTIDRLFG